MKPTPTNNESSDQPMESTPISDPLHGLDEAEILPVLYSLDRPSVEMPQSERVQRLRTRLVVAEFLLNRLSARLEEVDRQWSSVLSRERDHAEFMAMMGRCTVCMFPILERQFPHLPASILQAKEEGRFPNDGLCDRCIFGATYD